MLLKGFTTNDKDLTLDNQQVNKQELFLFFHFVLVNKKKVIQKLIKAHKIKNRGLVVMVKAVAELRVNLNHLNHRLLCEFEPTRGLSKLFEKHSITLY